MIRSFRLRLALSSALLTGLVLAAFGLSTWWLIRSVKIDRLDSALRTQAEREAGKPIPERDGEQIESAMESALGVRKPDDLVLLIEDAQGAMLYRSAQWPAALDANQLPWLHFPARHSGLDVPQWLIRSAQAQEQRWPPPAEFGPGEQNQRPGDRHPPRRLRPRPPWPLEQPRGPADQSPSPDGASNQPQSAPLPSDTSGQEARTPVTTAPPPRRMPPVSSVTGVTINGQAWRVALASGSAGRVAVAVNLRMLDEEMQGVRTAYLIAMPLALLLIGISAWIFSARALRPLEKLASATRRITVDGLDQRISAAGEDQEFVELIEVYNSMLARLRRSFQQAYRFSADAAHELKTPLAILQGQLERAINQTEAGSAIQVELTSILDEVRRLSTISRKLLLLSQADAGQLSINREPFNLTEALNNLVEDTQMLASQLQVSGDIQAGLMINADGSLLQQVLHNLISNAIKYNLEGGRIEISARALPQVVEVVIANTSRGIPESERERVFERFYRADPSRNRQVEGLGLGLALSREIARAHHGDLSFKVLKDNTVKFSLVLPR